MLLSFEGQQLTQGLPRTIYYSYSGNNMTRTKNIECQRTEIMREKRVIISPPERKFSKQMEISKEKEESTKAGESCQGDEREGHTFLSILLWFPSVLHKITLPASPELASNGCHTLWNLSAFKADRGHALTIAAGECPGFFPSHVCEFRQM